jgi:hypothetical protein
MPPNEEDNVLALEFGKSSISRCWEIIYIPNLGKEWGDTDRSSYTRYGSFCGKIEVGVPTTVRKGLGIQRPRFVYEIWWVATVVRKGPVGI